MKGYHERRVERSEEAFNKSVDEIIQIMTDRGKMPVAQQAQSNQDNAAPTLLPTPDGQRYALYYKGSSKWCPDGQWQLLHSPCLVKLFYHVFNVANLFRLTTIMFNWCMVR